MLYKTPSDFILGSYVQWSLFVLFRALERLESTRTGFRHLVSLPIKSVPLQSRGMESFAMALRRKRNGNIEAHDGFEKEQLTLSRIGIIILVLCIERGHVYSEHQRVIGRLLLVLVSKVTAFDGLSASFQVRSLPVLVLEPAS